MWAPAALLELVSPPRSQTPPPPFTPHTTLEPITQTDRDTMFRQIVKRRAYPVACSSRCKHGYPQVFVHAPMHVLKVASDIGGISKQSGKIHPDTRKAKKKNGQAEHAFAWLTCPMLNKEIDSLEEGGAIDDVAAVVARTPNLSDKLESAHETVPDARRWLLPEKWRQELESNTNSPVCNSKQAQYSHSKHILFSTGLAGVSLGNKKEVGNWKGNRVKCLHAHVGDFLVRGSLNPVGDLVLRNLRNKGVDISGTNECWRECKKVED